MRVAACLLLVLLANAAEPTRPELAQRILAWSQQAVALPAAGIGQFDRTCALETISDALVRVGLPGAAQTLYRAAHPGDALPDLAQAEHLPQILVERRVGMLCHQLVASLRLGDGGAETLIARIDRLADVITRQDHGEHAYWTAHWPLPFALALGGRVEAGLDRALALNDTYNGWLRVPELLAAAARAGHAAAADRLTDALLRQDNTWRPMMVSARLRAGDEAGAERLAAGLRGREADDHRGSRATRLACAGRLAEAERLAEGLGRDWFALAGDSLVQRGDWAAAAPFLAARPFRADDWAMREWLLHQGRPEPVEAAFLAERDACQRIERFRTALLRDWPAPASRAAGQRLRQALLAMRHEDGFWPWDTEDEYAVALTVAAIEGRWEVVATTLANLAKEGEYRPEACLRYAFIELSRDRLALALELRQRHAAGAAWEATGAWLARVHAAAGRWNEAEEVLAAQRSDAGRLEALAALAEQAALRWLGRPPGGTLAWMDPETGL